MTTNWQTRKLGEVLKFEYGKPLPKSDRDCEGKYPVYGANGVKSWSNSFYYDRRTIIVGRKGSAGEINLTEEKFWPLDVTYFMTFDDKKYDLNFLFNLLSNLELTKLAKGVKPGINRNDVYSIDVKVPLLSEQQRIVKILDEVFEKMEKAKENAEKNLQKAKELFELYLHIIFENEGRGMKKVRLGEIAKVMGGKRVPRGYKLKNEQTKHPYIRVADFNDYGSIDLDDILYIDDEIFEQIKRYTISSKDLYMSIAGTIGKTGIVPAQLDGANLTENACKLVFKDNIDPKYVYYFTKSKDFVNQAGFNTRVAAMPKLALSRLSTITFFIPESLSEQKTIVARLDALSTETKKLEAIYKQKLTNLEELKKSVLKKAFSGEL